MNVAWGGHFPGPSDPVRTIIVCLKAARNLSYDIDEGRGSVLREQIDEALLTIESDAHGWNRQTISRGANLVKTNTNLPNERVAWLQYMHSMLREFQKIAWGDRDTTLAYLIDMAAIEAASLGHRQRAQGRRSNGDASH